LQVRLLLLIVWIKYLAKDILSVVVFSVIVLASTASLWEMCKGWLDPRTQEKIEILGSGPDVNKRLLEFVDAEFLPKRYGGNAVDPEFFRDNAEYLWINRHTAVKKSITVLPGQKVVLDFYVTDGDVTFEAFGSTPATPNALTATATVFNTLVVAADKLVHHENVALSDVPKLVASEHLQLVEKKDVKGLESKIPIRTLVEYVNPSATENKTFVFFWGNSSRWTQRPLSYVVNICDV
jgi:hypothetical protein